MENIITDVGPASSKKRKLAFVQNAPKMVLFLKELGFQWRRTRFYPDYYPN